MRIFYLAYVRLPTEKAHGIQIMKVCEALASAGVEVELVIPGRKTSVAGDPFSYYGVARNFHITTLHTPDFLMFGSLGFIFSQLLFSWRTLSIVPSDAVVISQDELVLARHLRHHCHIIYEVHNGRWNRCAQFATHASLCVVANSEGTKRFYTERGIDPAKILVLPNGVDVERFAVSETQEEAREKLNLPSDKLIVLYTGHLYGWKGAHTLAESAKNLPDDVAIVFVGGTEHDVQKFRAKYGAEKNVYVLGHKPNADMPFYLRAADILVLPNARRGESEQFTSPMKLFEYLAAGKPIVASDLPSIREVLSDEDAFFFTPDDSRSLADAILAVFAHPSDASARAEHARTKAGSYTWNRRALVERVRSSL